MDEDIDTLSRVAITPNSSSHVGYSPRLRLRRSQESVGDLKSSAMAQQQQSQQRGRKNDKDLRIYVPGAHTGYYQGANGLPTPPSDEDVELDSSSDDGSAAAQSRRRRRGVELCDADRLALGVGSLPMAVF